MPRVRRPASESLQRRKPRVGRGKRCRGGYGDLRAAGELFGWDGSDRSSRMTVKGLMSRRRVASISEWDVHSGSWRGWRSTTA